MSRDVTSASPDAAARLASARGLCLAVRDCHRDDAVRLLSVILDDLGSGAPIPPFAGVMAEARHWAAWATPAELKAYAAAIFEAMDAADQAAFLRYIQPRIAA